MVHIVGSKNSKDKWLHFSGELPERKEICTHIKPRLLNQKCINTNSVFLRDTIKTVTSLREAKSVIYAGK